MGWQRQSLFKVVIRVCFSMLKSKFHQYLETSPSWHWPRKSKSNIIYIILYIHMFFFLGIFQSWKPCHFLTCSSMEETSRRWPNIIFSLGEYDNLPRHTLSMSKVDWRVSNIHWWITFFFAGVCQYGRLEFPMHQITKVIRLFHPPLVIFPAIKAPSEFGDFPVARHPWFNKSDRPLMIFASAPSRCTNRPLVRRLDVGSFDGFTCSSDPC